MKNKVFWIACIYFAVLLLVPSYMVCRHYDVLRTGEYYKIRVLPADPYDPFRGRYMAIRPDIDTYNYENEYVVLDKDAEGFAVSARFYQKPPKNEPYAKNFEITRYYMNENMAPRADKLRVSLSEEDSVYVCVAIKNGYYAISGLYVNEAPIETLVGE